MNILWITNIIFPEAEKLLLGSGGLRASGGWMIGAADILSCQPGIHLTVATLSSKVKELTRLEGEKINYYLLPYGKGNSKINHEYEPLWIRVKNEVNPDVVHLHGTEYSHGYAYILACGENNVCVSIQGLISVCYKYYNHGLTKKEIFISTTPASFIRGNILQEKRRLKKRGHIEIETIKKAQHIIGRTSWDKDHVWAINSNAKYHYGGETLRHEFYSGSTWKYEECVPHSIFLSQALTPIKGLHMVLRAMPLVLRFFPDATVRVAGPDVRRSNKWKDLLKISNYGNLIRKMINKYHLNHCITFVGNLDGVGMRKEYLMSNVFVCPSAIENSPNSLGEAQLLGVPAIASYVGGIPNMMRGDEDHMYRFEEVEMLANKLVNLFNQGSSINTEPMRKEALKRHDPERNAKELLAIYEELA